MAVPTQCRDCLNLPANGDCRVMKMSDDPCFARTTDPEELKRRLYSIRDQASKRGDTDMVSNINREIKQVSKRLQIAM